MDQRPSANADLNRPLRNILVLAATGNIGIPIVRALASHPTIPFTITALTRNAASVPSTLFPSTVRLLSTDYTPASLTPLFQEADAIISCLPATHIASQTALIDLAIACNVARFIPSEFGVNTTHPRAGTIMPITRPKLDVQRHLERRAAEGKIAYTTIYNGAFFDWFFRFPGDMGWDVEGARARATLYDGGVVPYEVTTVKRIADAVVAALSGERIEATRNRRVFVNSFTVTQKEILAVLEKVTGREFAVRYDSVEGLKARTASDWGSEKDGRERALAAELLEACLHGQEGLNLFSRDPEVRGLWNERLGLEEGSETLESAVKDVLAEGKKSGLPEGLR